MNFIWSTLHVRNMEESLNFYQEVVGLDLVERFSAGPGMEIAFLGSGETKIELIHQESNANPTVGPNISWGFEVESLEEVIEKLSEKNIKIASGPFEPNPTMCYIFVLDPNGMTIQFVENHR